MRDSRKSPRLQAGALRIVTSIGKCELSASTLSAAPFQNLLVRRFICFGFRVAVHLVIQRFDLVLGPSDFLG
jgi:hypothetical protein